MNYLYKDLDAARELCQINKIRLTVKAYIPSLLKETCSLITDRINSGVHDKSNIKEVVLGEKPVSVKIVGPVPLPTRKKIYCVLRSPHVNKNSREHFEIRIHKRLIDILSPSDDIINILKNLDVPSGVEINSVVSKQLFFAPPAFPIHYY